MKRRIPLLIVLVFGIIFIIQHYVPHYYSKFLEQRIFVQWMLVIGCFALVMGVYSLVSVHIDKIKKKKEKWGYSIVTLSSLGLMIFIGIFFPNFFGGNREGSLYDWFYVYFYASMQSTMFALLAFFIASAAYRAFRARTLESSLLLVAAIIVMLGRVPIGTIIWSGFPDIVQWILEIPNMAAKRAILFGIALGSIATSLKIIFGIERSWLGGE